MKRRYRHWRADALLVDYKALGTVSVREFSNAFIEDIHVLEDLYRVQYVTGGRLYLPVTNEYGERLQVVEPGGGPVQRINTHHFRPACLDYDL